MDTISLKCPKCQAKSEVLVLTGFKGIISSWTYRCNFCRLHKTGGFWFFDCLSYCLMMFIPLVIFLYLGPRTIDGLIGQQYRTVALIGGSTIALSTGFFLSKCYLKHLLNQYLKHTKDTVPNTLR